MEVKIKKLNINAVIPSYSIIGDAGMDLVATSKRIDEYGNIVYGTGLSFEIPDGYVGLVYPRSSCSHNDLFMSNSVGVIDSGFRGEVMVKFRPLVKESNWLNCFKPSTIKKLYNICDRVAQIIIIPYPSIEFVESDNLTTTKRGTKGYGSTGK